MNDHTKDEKIFAALQAYGCKPKRNQESITAICPCPAHDGREVKLLISDQMDGGFLPVCDEQCSIADIAGALGLTVADFWEPSRRQPVLTCLADVEAREVAWLWRGRIPLGRLTLLVGRPGEGKSFLTIYIAATVTRGGMFPDGSICPSGSVILISAEDDAGDTIRPRMDAAGGDVNKVHLLSGVEWRDETGERREVCFTLQNLAQLEAALQAHPDCRLLVIDPIGSYLGAEADAHRDNEVRAVLAPVAKLAEKHGVAVLIVAHRRKSGGSFADDLAMGSRGFTGIARAVWHLSRDPENKNRRLLLSGKNNLAVEGTGLAFAIDGNPPAIVWEDLPVELNADEGLDAENNADHEKPGPEPAALRAAADFLRKVLGAGEVDAGEVQKEAKAAGLNFRTVQRAADALGVRREKQRFGGGWRWRLPASAEGDKARTNSPNSKELVVLSSSVEQGETTRTLPEGDKLFDVGVNVSPSADSSMRTPNGPAVQP